MNEDHRNPGKASDYDGVGRHSNLLRAILLVGILALGIPTILEALGVWRAVAEVIFCWVK